MFYLALRWSLKHIVKDRPPFNFPPVLAGIRTYLTDGGNRLNSEQQRILDAVRSGANVFFTGPAGSGKSEVVRHIREYMDYKNTRYAVTAPTGVAAVLIGGRTIHSWSGLESRSPIQYSQLIVQAPETDVLIIDEISMVCNHKIQCIFKIFILIFLTIAHIITAFPRSLHEN